MTGVTTARGYKGRREISALAPNGGAWPGAPGSPFFWANLGFERSSNSFWQKRYYDCNIRDAREFGVELRYLHRNPVKRGLVKEPGDWKWSSFRHCAFHENGVVEIESEWTARDRELKMFGGPARPFLSPG